MPIDQGTTSGNPLPSPNFPPSSAPTTFTIRALPLRTGSTAAHLSVPTSSGAEPAGHGGCKMVHHLPRMLVDVGQEMAETIGMDWMVALKKGAVSPGWKTDTVFPLLDSDHWKLATCSRNYEPASLVFVRMLITTKYLTGDIPIMTSYPIKERASVKNTVYF
jgi:hypothetical protein